MTKIYQITNLDIYRILNIPRQVLRSVKLYLTPKNRGNVIRSFRQHDNGLCCLMIAGIYWPDIRISICMAPNKLDT